MNRELLPGGKRVLIVLFVPSVERDGKTKIDQERWVTEALEMFGQVFGGATAYPKAKGVWKDNKRGGNLVHDEPVVIHCYTTPDDIGDDTKLKKLAAFCEHLLHGANQGEVGLVIGDEFYAFR